MSSVQINTNRHEIFAPEIVINPATPDDWQDYRDLRVEMLANEQHAFGKTPDDLDQISDAEWEQDLSDVLDGKDRQVLIARDLGSTAAAGMVGVYRHPEHGMLIGRLYVSPIYRGSGVGGQLLDGAESFVLDQGKTASYLFVGNQNPKARDWYMRNGYEPTGVLRLPIESDGNSELLVKNMVPK